MRLKQYMTLGLIASSLAFGSCSKFLDVETESHVVDKDIISDKRNLNAYILELYKNWRDAHKDRVTMYMGTDEAVLGGVQWRDNNDRRGIENYLDGMNSTNGAILNTYKNRFLVAQRAADIIGLLVPEEASNDAETNRYLAELCILRAINHFELTQLFGEIPLADELQNLGARQSLETVYKHIEADLTLAAKYLPEPGDSDLDPRRATTALAQAMLGKLYLYAPEASGMRSYEKAAEQFKLIYENPYFGGKGASDFSSLFDVSKQGSADYKQEIIYAFQFNNVSGDNNSIQWDFGSRAVTDLTSTEAVALFAGFDAMMPSEYAYKDQADGGLWEEGDVRKDQSIRYDFVWEGKTPTLETGYRWGDELDPHVKKFEDPRILEQNLSVYYSGKNLAFIRFADVVLNYAECLYHLGQQGEAIDMINDIVRTRAFGGTLPADKRWDTGMGEEEFMTKLMDERMRELCFEGWRKMDLIRTGKLKEYVEARNRWVMGLWNGKPMDGVSKTSIEDFRLLWPMPLDELRQNPELNEGDQNPGY